MSESLKEKYPENYKIVETLDGLIIVFDEKGEVVDSYTDVSYQNSQQNSVSSQQKYEYDPDRGTYYNTDDYGGFPSHW